jgi:DNA polymerase-4
MEQLVGIYREYTPDVEMLSIDEAVLQLKGTPVLKRLGMEGIAREIRSKILERVGCWMKCSYGIGTNRFLAKTAAGLKKPDGLNTISHTNVIEVLSKLKLTDLCGIANKNQARLNSKGIFTPLEFLAAPVDVLEKMVFESIEGYYWHLRLRGIEIDDAPTTRGVFGNSYSLQRPTTDKREISRLALKLCEKAGRRMRQAGYSAQGVHVSCVYNRKDHWHEGKKFKSGLVTTDELHVKAQYLLNRQPWLGSVTNLAISCFSLEQSGSANQLTLFEDDFTKKRKLSVALDSINDKYGEYTIYKALMHGMDDQIIDRISFGGVKELVEQAFKQG